MIIQIGSMFAILALWHFIIDWLGQSQKDAIAKSTNWRIRFDHCFYYALWFVLLGLAFNFHLLPMCLSFGILFISHFIIDTYIPTYLWVKYVRQPAIPTWDFTIEKFKEYAATPIGSIITITVDQIFHLIFVFVVAVFCVLL